MLVHLSNGLDWLLVTMAYFLRSNEAILDFPFPDENILTVKGLDIEHASVPTLVVNNE